MREGRQHNRVCCRTAHIFWHSRACGKGSASQQGVAQHSTAQRSASAVQPGMQRRLHAPGGTWLALERDVAAAGAGAGRAGRRELAKGSEAQASLHGQAAAFVTTQGQPGKLASSQAPGPVSHLSLGPHRQLPMASLHLEQGQPPGGVQGGLSLQPQVSPTLQAAGGRQGKTKQAVGGTCGLHPMLAATCQQPGATSVDRHPRAGQGRATAQAQQRMHSSASIAPQAELPHSRQSFPGVQAAGRAAVRQTN